MVYYLFGKVHKSLLFSELLYFSLFPWTSWQYKSKSNMLSIIHLRVGGGDHWFSDQGCQLSIRIQKQLLYYHKSDIDLCLAQGEIYLAFIIKRLRSVGLSYCSFLHQKRSQSSGRGSRPLLTIHTDTDIVGLFKLELS